jgi:hypothetical protein
MLDTANRLTPARGFANDMVYFTKFDEMIQIMFLPEFPDMHGLVRDIWAHPKIHRVK